ncbi:hypothetical protein Flexsi_2325 [Flexistipes sinusarabici DSM 4947]|uniref:Glycine zipper 2TM domain-containing protein n=1 Tax=Flexistipes sinusarabici (strain ATCC 49648 / DSM 4947 / MAS 10) TaxID=717231 RepID=F8E6P7_FLESM|nr:hypothetical protein [Flexistipes sinusarabici]AEI15937.1 hypothetical protein Flexsi_2325 [Flexistipes sinusarabici DSM 4947]
MKKLIGAGVLIVFLMSVIPASAETRGSIVIQDTLYGTITGAIIGTAAIVFTEEPEDNLDYIAYGAATGAIVGTVFGVYESTALVEIENGETKIAMPTIKTSIKNSDGKTAVETKADFVRVNF